LQDLVRELSAAKERAEAAFIRKQLEVHGWNVTKTAEALDIQRSHLYNKMKKYGLAKEDDGPPP
jgi:DNA-binding NtrC family response regulator